MSQTDCLHVLIPSLPPSLAMLPQPLQEARGAPDTSNDEEIARLLQQELSLEEVSLGGEVGLGAPDMSNDEEIARLLQQELSLEEVSLGEARLGKVRLGEVRLGKVRMEEARETRDVKLEADEMWRPQYPFPPLAHPSRFPQGGHSHSPAAPPPGSSTERSGGAGGAVAGRVVGGGQQHPVWSALLPPMCAGCGESLGFSPALSSMGGLWHPHCFTCHACKQTISEKQFNIKDGKPYHAACHRQLFHPKCAVCQDFIRPNPEGMINFRSHPFWGDKWCPGHMTDSTPSCTSCCRLQSRGSPPFIDLPDGRHLCLDCVDSAVLDSADCRPLFSSVSDFFAQLGMPVRQHIPVLAVEQQALNDAQRAEREGHEHGSLTRGLCLSEEQTIQMLVRLPGSLTHASSFSAVGQQTMTVSRHCAVTAILVLYGLPRCAWHGAWGTIHIPPPVSAPPPHPCLLLFSAVPVICPSTPIPIRVLTASILAHELMHAWFKLDGMPPFLPIPSSILSPPPDAFPQFVYVSLQSPRCIHLSAIPCLPLLGPVTPSYKAVKRLRTRLLVPISHPVPCVGGFRHLPPELEEGMCQVMAYLWLQTQTPPAPHAPSQGPSVQVPSQQASSAAPLAHEAHSSFRQRFAAFCLHSIATDASPVYGDGFRAAHAAVLKHGLLPTLEHIRAHRALPRV
ncbi:unnamed protein product [Closterium sp. Naga37s-1]|nr:unnamed protein product [Closterium sp. Naga37s-1]